MKKMKTIMTGLLMLSVSLALSQTQNTYNFKIKGEKLIWQKVYETEMSKDQQKKYFENLGIIREIHVNENDLNGIIYDIKPLYKDLGYNRMTIPAYASLELRKIFVNIDFKDNKYRATIKEIQLSEVDAKMDYYAIKRDKKSWRPLFMKHPIKILNHTFDDLMTIKEVSDDNW